MSSETRAAYTEPAQNEVRWVPSAVRGRWTQAHILRSEAIPVDNHLQRKKKTSFLSTESHRTCKPYLRTGSSPTRWQQAENELNGIFGEVLFCLVMLYLSWFFFINFRGLLLLHYDFWFVCVNGLYMYMNVFLCVSLSFSAWMFCFILVLIICLVFCLF